MDQLNSMFMRLKRGLSMSSSGDNSQPPEKQQQLTSASSTECAFDDDGFVLLGQNECDETTVYASTPEKVAGLNTAHYNLVNNPNADRAGRGLSMFATCEHTSMASSFPEDAHDHIQGITFHPAVFGVPFQINPRLQEKDRLKNLLRQLDLETSQFDWQKYNYDFDFEQSCLRDLCAMEDRAKLMDIWTGSSS